ncbi:MAG TPA: glycoside hydrolase family 2 protein, partial [Phnomibacter sp.]|nr:glycoside hydrolase family 2 protein [Phnomibacter sp.]
AAWYGVKEAYRDDVIPQRDKVRPIDLPLKAPGITWKWKDKTTLQVESKAFAKYVYIHTSDSSLPQLSDNYFDLEPGVPKTITLNAPFSGSQGSIQVVSLFDVLNNANKK